MKSFDWAAADASVSHLKRLSQSNNGQILSDVLQATAEHLGCGERTLWRWAKNGLPKPKQSRELTKDHLLAIALAQGNLKRARGALHSQGSYAPGYRQFAKDFQTLDPVTRTALRNGVEEGISQGLFLKSNPEARLDRVIFDHTEADIRLQRVHNGKLEMFRPWISLIIDSGTRFILSTVITEGDGLKGDPNTESLVALMAAAIRGQYANDGTFVGGLPRLVQCDNAKAHLANAMLSGFLQLGITGKLIAPGSPWQDGKVERLMRTFKDEFLATLPGFTGAIPIQFSLGRGYGRWIRRCSELELICISKVILQKISWAPAKCNTLSNHRN
jgi:transposase InsO family protein